VYHIGDDANKPDWKVVKTFLLKEGKLRKDQVIQMAKTSIEIMSNISPKF
jgi:hypothetical protein